MRDFKNEQEVKEYFLETGQKILIFEGTVYDVDIYIAQHPGGQDYLLQYLGKCIDEVFEEHGHTKSARLIFRDLDKIGFIAGDNKSTHGTDKLTNIKGLDGL